MKYLLMIAVVASSWIAGAENMPLARSIEWTPLWQAPGPIAISLENETAKKTVEIPKLEVPEGQVLCLRFQARLNTPKPAGWNNYLGLQWNGVTLDGRTKNGHHRVLNRHDSFVTTNPSYPEIALVIPRGMPCFNVFFGPPNEPLQPEIVTDRNEGYWYLMTLQDLPLADSNKLTVFNTALKSYWNGAPPAELPLVIENFSIGSVSFGKIVKLETMDIVQRTNAPLGNDVPILEKGFQYVRPCSNGGLYVISEKCSYFFEVSFSFPNDRGMGFNSFSCLPRVEGVEPGWNPEVTVAGDALLVRATGSNYIVERRITCPSKGHMSVQDTITNLASSTLGLAVKNCVIAEGLPSQCLLAGLDVSVLPSATYPENPTIFVRPGRYYGLGIVVEDDATRLQLSRRKRENTVEFGTDRLGLAPHEQYVMKYSIYDAYDYFDFINKVRADWNVNFTVEGPFDFFDATSIATPEGREAAKQLILRKNMKLFGLTPWFEYYNGWTWSRDDYKKLMKDAQAFVKSVVPDAKCLSCIETNLVPVDLSFFGDTIPKEGWPIGREAGGKYGQKTTAAMTACIDNSPWRDSCLRDADGSVLLDCWYVQHYKDKPALNLMVYPTLDNYRHKNMLEQIAWLLDDVGLDGVYIDQFSLAWSADNNRYTKEKWDGRTVMLDADGRVKSKVCDLGLISSPARAQWLREVLKRNKTVVCNTNPVTRELQSLPAFRFMETQGYEPMAGDGPPEMQTLSKGQLGSPIGLGHSFPGNAGADFFVRTVAAHLRYGQLYYYYSTTFPSEDVPGGRLGGEFGPVNHMFPFTPVELHEGWLLGKERLITCVSGDFPWPYDREPKPIFFDSRGREKPLSNDSFRHNKDTKTMTIHLKDWWETAVIE